MPWNNVPRDQWDAMEKCVTKVMAHGHTKDSATAICFSSIVKGKETMNLGETLKNFLTGTKAAADGDELTDAEIFAIDRLYLDVQAGKVTLASLEEPETGKAIITQPGGDQDGRDGQDGDQPGAPGKPRDGDTTGGKQDRCYFHLKRLGVADADARKICRRALGIASQKATAEDNNLPDSAFLYVEPGGDKDGEGKTTPRSLRHLPYKTSSGAMDLPRLRNALSRLGQSDTGKSGGDRWLTSDLRDRLRAKAEKILADANGEEKETGIAQDATVTVQKQADGTWRWLIVSSSSFMDRDREIVSQAALEEDTGRMNAAKEFGTLDWWHTPIVLGTCDFSAMHGRLSIESGTFADELVAVKLAEHANELAASRSFRHSVTEPDASGTYNHIRTFARALLPRGKESNLLTQVSIESKELAMDETKKKQLVDLLGGDKAAEDKVSAILAGAEKAEGAALAAGIAHKEETPAPPAAPEPKPEKEPGMFVTDMTPEEFTAKIGEAMGVALKAAIDPMLAELKGLKDAQATSVKEAVAASGTQIVAEIGKLAQGQKELGERVAGLEGLTPRGYRPTQDPNTKTDKAVTLPADDENAKTFLATFVERVAGGQALPKP